MLCTVEQNDPSLYKPATYSGPFSNKIWYKQFLGLSILSCKHELLSVVPIKRRHHSAYLTQKRHSSTAHISFYLVQKSSSSVLFELLPLQE